MKTYLAVDLGAGSGRVMAARYDGQTLQLETVSRFDNTPVEFAGHHFWNLPSLLTNIREGLAKARSLYGEIASVGVDTWGVDYGLIDRAGRLLALPYCYRDVRNCPDNTSEVLHQVGRRNLYRTTGIQIMDFNTIFQLHSERSEACSLLDLADRLLFMPDLINYALCGVMANEATVSSTSGLIDLGTRTWSEALLGSINVSPALLRKPVMPGTVLGTVRGIPGLEQTPVIAVGGHDTASAVASVPADESTDWGYLATGTWALMGVEEHDPILNDRTYELNYTHECAVTGDFRFLKNCTGMWMVQELRRAWTVDGKAPAYDTMMREAEAAEPFRSFIDPDYLPFTKPGNLPEKMVQYCRLTQQPEPRTRGEFYRAAMEGIVMRYREVWSELAMLTGRKRSVLHMIGGAIRDDMHCRFTADALGIALTCGPVEGASIGNTLAQMVGLGDLASFREGRALSAASTELKRWEPSVGTDAWTQAFPAWLSRKQMASGER